MAERLYFSLSIDCEATQPAIADAALGERASRGFAEVLEGRGLRGTFHVLPGDIEAHGDLYRELHARGHELGLHVHPAADGHQEFLGVYGPDDQARILRQAADRFSQVVGFPPDNICVGYLSTNDFTYGVLHNLGFRHGTTSLPTRVLPECASVHAGAPLDVHYAHRFNRVLVGDLDYVEIPPTIDPDSRMWGGRHPLDLRIELVDAKNHWYTIDKAVRRQVQQAVPVKVIRAATHNTFEYADPRDFRRQTLGAVIEHAFRIAETHGLECVAATGAEIARAYRAAVPRESTAASLSLDRRGYGPQQK
ncbi:MAG: polysaccharide deacetylase family protein [Pirellulales bacterium]|nr:polysaccharide deacetylase family protein [Pirellulales bacterium]